MGLICVQKTLCYDATSHWILGGPEGMRRRLLKSKLHRATVTEADLHYEGSVTIDGALLDAADIREFEQVDVLDIDNGNRLTTYAIRGEPGRGDICLNGAAARLVHPGDLVIIASYADFEEAELADHQPTVVFVDEKNRVKELAKTELPFRRAVAR